MRCFAALDVTGDIIDTIGEAQKSLTPYDVKLVEPYNLHFTLKFFGDITEPQASAIIERLQGITFPSFTLTLEGMGVFPSDTFIRVIWIGSPTTSLHNLHSAVNEAVADLFPPEKTIPHLTLARVRTAQPALKDVIQHYATHPFGALTISSFSLKQSVVTRQGPVYTTLATFPLSE